MELSSQFSPTIYEGNYQYDFLEQTAYGSTSTLFIYEVIVCSELYYLCCFCVEWCCKGVWHFTAANEIMANHHHSLSCFCVTQHAIMQFLLTRADCCHPQSSLHALCEKERNESENWIFFTIKYSVLVLCEKKMHLMIICNNHQNTVCLFNNAAFEGGAFI